MHLAERRGESDAELNQAVDEAVRNHFTYRAGATRHELRELPARGRISLVIGLAFARRVSGRLERARVVNPSALR